MPIFFNSFLIKALALALAASQVFLDHGIQLSFDSEEDQARVLEIMQSGCKIMRQRINEQIPVLKELDPIVLLDTKIRDARATNQSTLIFRGLKLEDLKVAYNVFCTGEVPPEARLLLTEVMAYYNSNLRDLPDIEWLKGYRLPTYSSIQDRSGQHIADVFRASRRENVAIEDVPERVKLAFLAAEDQNFYDEASHHGVDQKGLARAGIKTLMTASGQREQGGSTITQQLVKNLVVGSKETYERKLREMVLAYQLEKILSKEKIHELYINHVYLGRSCWGIKLGAQCWFGKTLEQLTNAEIAFLAGLPKGPRLYNPDRDAARSLERTNAVLKQMATSKVARPKLSNGATLEPTPVISEAEYQQALRDAAEQKFSSFDLPTPSNGFHFMDELVFTTKRDLNIDPLQSSVKITSTLNARLQVQVEAAVQESLALYEIKNGRAQFENPEGNIAEQIKAAGSSPNAWRTVLAQQKRPLKDVHWPLATVLSLDPKDGARVGLTDGRIVKLKPFGQIKLNTKLKQYDIIYVKLDGPETASLRFRPEVQAAAVVMENNGRVVSMVGGFSHQLSQLNRAAHTIRSPGSTAKVATYLAALQNNIQPNTLILDGHLRLTSNAEPAWPPDGGRGTGSVVTLRNGLEMSRNLVAARLLTHFGVNYPQALDQVLNVMKECGLHNNPPRHFPAILGGGVETTVLRVATCYASVVNGGQRPKPYFVESIFENGRLVHKAKEDLTPMPSIDRESAWQMRRLLQGVVVRGTADELNTLLADVIRARDPKASAADFIGGKTGTSQESLDAWFVGFTKDLTIAVWVGYDNESKETRRTLGAEATAARVAVPVWEKIFRATLDTYPLEFLPEPEDGVRLVTVKTQRDGRIMNTGAVEYHRISRRGTRIDTWAQFNELPPPPAPPPPPFFATYPPPPNYPVFRPAPRYPAYPYPYYPGYRR